MSARISVRITPAAEGWQRVTDMIADLGQQEQWSPELVFQVQLVLDEIGDNFVDHGHISASNTMEVTLISARDAVTVEIVDDGVPFNPLTDAPPPDLDSDLADRSVGGLGLHIVRTIMDDIQYQRDQGRNHWVLTKHRAL